ncbi:MAG: hypothetical protein H6823_11150 [Planctomycetaceae bacterium]|nr:hypothetical protein [Planctomycetales bacterium]MCB9938791.1 hypothetical protein [Planctomycetaceae bacterium]
MSNRFASVVCLLFVVSLSGVAQSEGPRLSREDQRAADQVARAYFAGNSLLYAELVSGWLRKSNDARLANFDAALTAVSVPTTGELMTEAHLHAVHNGLTSDLPSPSSREVLVVVEQLGSHVSTLVRMVYQNDLMKDPLPDPATLREYDDVVWESQMLESKARDAAQIVRHMQLLASKLSKTQLAKLDESGKTLLEETDEILGDVEELLDELGERQAEVRLKRLALALRRLQDPMLNAEKIRAAYTAPLDAESLTSYLSAAKEHQRVFKRQTLMNSQLIQQVAADRETARQLAGDLTEKSQRLFVGLNWWLRGRYGVGSEVFGLAKSPAAMHSMQAQMALYMPQQLPRPNDRQQNDSQQQPSYSQQQQSPCYDRRHHYWWAWEDRRVQRTTTSSVQTNRQAGDPNSISYRTGRYFM